jgi:hypothetical protein
MVAALLPILSDQPPDVARRAGLGDRFHYFRGHSGRRYLFSTVAVDELPSFRSAVVMLARPNGSDRLAAYALTNLDQFGRPVGSPGPWPPSVPVGTTVLVHLLADRESDRLDVVDDLTSDWLALAA